MWKRLRKLRNRLYETLMMWMTSLDPKPMQHAKEPASEVNWRPASAQHCPECTWVWLMWDAFVEQWVCPHCGTSRYPALAITEKRAVVVAATVWQSKQTTPVPRSISMPLLEQQAEQPPYRRSGLSYQQTQKFEPRRAQVFKKWHTGEIYLDENGKPRYSKSGLPVHTDQFALLRIPTHEDHRRTGSTTP